MLHVVLVATWVLSGFSGFLLTPKNMLIGILGVSLYVCVCVCGHGALQWRGVPLRVYSHLGRKSSTRKNIIVKLKFFSTSLSLDVSHQMNSTICLLLDQVFLAILDRQCISSDNRNINTVCLAQYREEKGGLFQDSKKCQIKGGKNPSLISGMKQNWHIISKNLSPYTDGL